jgi:hypothetical protein
MDKINKALLIVGSPKLANSASEALGKYLLHNLHDKGFKIDKINMLAMLKSENGIQELLSAIDRTEMIILSCPLYVDSPPAAVIKAMELIVEAKVGKKQKIITISNCGFPEAHHNNVSLEIYKNFSIEAGFEWMGGLALGAGPSIGGRDLTELGGMVKDIRKSLDLIADDICNSKQISREAQDLMRKSIIPSWTYLLLGGFMWKQQARKNGVAKKINNRPYLLKK